MKKFAVTFKDTFEAENENEAYEALIKYLIEVVENEDVTAFSFEEE